MSLSTLQTLLAGQVESLAEKTSPLVAVPAIADALGSLINQAGIAPVQRMAMVTMAFEVVTEHIRKAGGFDG